VRGGLIWLGFAVLLAAGCVDAVREQTQRGPGPAHTRVSSAAQPDRTARPAPSISLKEHARDDGGETYTFTTTSSGDNGQAGNAVRGWYFKHAQSRAPLVIVVPIYGTMAYPSWTMARFLTQARTPLAMNVVLLEADADLTDWRRLQEAPTEAAFLQAVSEATARYRTTAEDISRIIDWAVTRPETDPERLGIVGFSLSATIAAIAMTQDTRLSAGAFVMGGAHLHEIFAFCAESRVADVRRAVTARFGWSVDTFKLKIQSISDAIDPARMPSVNGHRRTLYVEATGDDYIPPSARDALRATLGPSVHIKLNYRHWPAFLRGMSLLSLHYIERTVVAFLEDAFSGGREAPRWEVVRPSP
jgi:dienelactone hydrolase